MDFGKIAPYLQDPLVLAGFALFLFFGLANGLIKSGLIPTQTKQSGFLLLRRILLYGFVLSILIVLLGFGLKYREMSRNEQVAAAHLVINELKADRAVAGSLAANSATALEIALDLATVLRSRASPLLKTLFPYENLEPKKTTPAPSQMARQQIGLAISLGLPSNQSELNRMNDVARLIRGTIARTRPTVESLADKDGSRYRISRDAWRANLSIIRRISIVDLTAVGQTYSDIELSRSEYNVLLRYDLIYMDALGQFLSFHDHAIDESSLAAVLAAEREYFSISAAYAASLEKQIRTSTQAIKRLDTAISSS